MQWIQLTPELEVAHIGPPLDKGRLPAVFYYALSASESLELDPYNQPAVYLAEKGVRVFSLNLPAHGPSENAIDAMGVWAQEFSSGKDPLTPFIEKSTRAIDALIERGWIVREKIGLMGLSRGGLIASLVAANHSDVRAVVGFAPLVKLSKAKEFIGVSEDRVSSFDLENLADDLQDKTMRFYIGNRDVRVGTRKCFDLVEHITESAYQAGKRSPEIEMVITPSIGHMGHGTSKEVFHQGAHFLGKKLGLLR